MRKAMPVGMVATAELRVVLLLVEAIFNEKDYWITNRLYSKKNIILICIILTMPKYIDFQNAERP